MTGETVKNFQSISKFPLVNYIKESKSFFDFSYPLLVKYLKGKSNEIDQRHIKKHAQLLKSATKISELFNANKSKLKTVDFWELLVFLEEIRLQLEMVTKLPMYLRSSRTNFNYGSSFSFPYTMTQQQTLEQVSSSVLQDNVPDNDWAKIAISNDLLETGWDIDGGTELTLYKEKFIDNFVTSVIDVMAGEKIYGLDIYRQLTFENDDLKTLSYKETVFQTVEILVLLKKGDIPEFPRMGVNAALYAGGNIRGLTYSSVIRELNKTFKTDDLFEYLKVTTIVYKDGDLFLDIEVKTKYDLLVQQTAVI